MAQSIISTRPAAVNPYIALTFAEYCVLGDALIDLADHFETADGMTERKAWASAHTALKIDKAEWRAAGAAHSRAERAAAADSARVMRKAKAFAAAEWWVVVFRMALAN